MFFVFNPTCSGKCQDAHESEHHTIIKVQNCTSVSLLYVSIAMYTSHNYQNFVIALKDLIKKVQLFLFSDWPIILADHTCSKVAMYEHVCAFVHVQDDAHSVKIFQS